MAEHVLAAPATKTVTINGTDYEMEVGNVTLALEISDWVEALGAVGDGSDPQAFHALAEQGREMVASALGDRAADDLLGGRHRLDLFRMVQLLRIIADEMDADAAMEEMRRALEGFADTADDD